MRWLRSILDFAREEQNWRRENPLTFLNELEDRRKRARTKLRKRILDARIKKWRKIANDYNRSSSR